MTHAGSPIHPVVTTNIKDGYSSSDGGLTKREYFAGLAMQGILATETEDGHYHSKDKLVEQAILYADELLKQLDKD